VVVKGMLNPKTPSARPASPTRPNANS